MDLIECTYLKLFRLAKKTLILSLISLFISACSSSDFSDTGSIGTIANTSNSVDNKSINGSEDAEKKPSILEETKPVNNFESIEEPESLNPEQEDDSVATPVMTTGAYLIKCEELFDKELLCKVVSKINNSLKKDINSIQWDVYQGEILLPSDQISIEMLESDSEWQIKIIVEAEGEWQLKPIDKDQTSYKNYKIIIEQQLEMPTTGPKSPNPVSDESSIMQSPQDYKPAKPAIELNPQLPSSYNFPLNYFLSLDTTDRHGLKNNATFFTVGVNSIRYDLEHDFSSGLTLIIWAKTIKPGSNHPRLFSLVGDSEVFIKWDHQRLRYAGGISCSDQFLEQEYAKWIDSGTGTIDELWHQLALTYDGEVLTFYYDGTISGSLTTTK
ncbi:MAG: hypothetical protein AB8G05_16275 [Oligoflexales bacterium]